MSNIPWDGEGNLIAMHTLTVQAIVTRGALNSSTTPEGGEFGLLFILDRLRLVVSMISDWRNAQESNTDIRLWHS